MRFRLIEEGTWTGTVLDVELKGKHVQFSVNQNYKERFPNEFDLRDGDQESKLLALFDLLDLQSWKDLYQPGDVDSTSTVDDGWSWRLEVDCDSFAKVSRGVNAFPSFRSAKETSIIEE